MRPPLGQKTWGAVAGRTLRPSNSSGGRRRPRNLLTLAIETSCDDTCVALLSKDEHTGRATIHFHRKATSDHRAFGGVYPPVALRGHDASLAPLIARALSSLPPAPPAPPAPTRPGATYPDKTILVAGCRSQKPDFVTVTRGPGMSANLASGLATAKGLAAAWQVPLVAVNHMQAHALTPRLVSALDAKGPRADDPAFPFLTLLVSGGHTQLVYSRSITDHRILAATKNIGVGDALDKAAKHILPADMIASHTDVMYGALLERFAFPASVTSTSGWNNRVRNHDYGYTPPLRRGDEIKTYVNPSPHPWQLTPPLSLSREMIYEFNGLGSEIRKVMQNNGANMPTDQRRVVARVAMRLLFEHLASRIFLAMEEEPKLRDGLKTLVVSGGVASNGFLLHILRRTMNVRGLASVEITAPPPGLCTDNAAMIAWAGMEMYEAGWTSELSVSPEKKWSIDSTSEGGGILGIGGWIKRDA